MGPIGDTAAKTAPIAARAGTPCTMQPWINRIEAVVPTPLSDAEEPIATIPSRHATRRASGRPPITGWQQRRAKPVEGRRTAPVRWPARAGDRPPAGALPADTHGFRRSGRARAPKPCRPSVAHRGSRHHRPTTRQRSRRFCGCMPRRSRSIAPTSPVPARRPACDCSPRRPTPLAPGQAQTQAPAQAKR